jgi:hypothetical protein
MRLSPALLAACLLGGCAVDGRVPEVRLACGSGTDCPAGWHCVAVGVRQVCCSTLDCNGLAAVAGPADGAPPGPDAATDMPIDTPGRDVPRADIPSDRPPADTPSDRPPADTPSDRPPADTAVTCTPGSLGCLVCCRQATPDAVAVYAQTMYTCACIDTCYTACADSLCNSNQPDPSAACIACIKQSGNGSQFCRDGNRLCAENVGCAAYLTCAHGCL